MEKLHNEELRVNQVEDDEKMQARLATFTGTSRSAAVVTPSYCCYCVGIHIVWAP
jgi:hypothetical protein